MFYDRKIKYLEDRRDGEHIRTVGFVKAEVRGEQCRMSIHVAGLYKTDTFEKSILVLGGGREGKLCDIKLMGGRGDTGELCFPSNQLGRAGISYGELEEIRIPLAAGRELRCLWKNREAKAAKAGQDMAQESVPKEGKPKEGISRESMRKASVYQEDVSKEGMPEASMPQAAMPQTDVPPTDILLEGPLQERMPEEDIRISEQDVSGKGMRKQNTLQKDISKVSEEGMPEAGILQAATPKDVPPRPPLMEDKWNQLWSIYPRIAPFQDEREYLSIEPQDFVIFPVKYYQLVNNSFLLHGYHNYQHLILTQMLYRGEMRYYIGVPGNYYEKEKQVAIMFGFESFECKAEPAQTGDYGYYMMRIAL